MAVNVYAKVAAAVQVDRQGPVDCRNIVLRRFPWLAEEDDVVFACSSRAVQRFQPHEDILTAHSPTPGVYAIRSGFACRYAILANGQRQIMGFVLPGDLCEPHAAVFDRVDYSVAALRHVEAVLIPNECFSPLTGSSPSLLRALWRVTAIGAAIDRQWLLNIGQRTAFERMAHLLCELYTRLETVGLTGRESCEFPLTQAELAEATALSTVHVNRVLMEMRHAGLIGLSRHRLTLHDAEGLRAIAGFSADYLSTCEVRNTYCSTIPATLALVSSQRTAAASDNN
jgi:CRP-like cAMP-binding protein